MAKAAAGTGVGPTVMVAIEQHFPEDQRIIKDDLAYRILPLTMRIFVRLLRVAWIRDWMVRTTEKNLPGIWSAMMCRKRYIDEKLIESVDQINAVVNLGAGFDTRIYRFPILADIPVWEVDQPENIRSKQARLCKIFGMIPSHVRLVSIDFDNADLDSVLVSYGYSTDRPTFFIMEAVTQYLPEDSIRKTFDFLEKSVHGSRLAFTYIRRDFLNGKVMSGWEKGYKVYVVNDKIWLFGMDPEEWPGFLKEYGWKVIEDIDYGEMAERYVKPTYRILASTSVERMIYAEKI